MSVSDGHQAECVIKLAIGQQARVGGDARTVELKLKGTSSRITRASQAIRAWPCPFGQKTRTTGSPAPKRGKHGGAGDGPVRFCGWPVTPSPGAGQGAVMDWSRILAYVAGTVDQEGGMSRPLLKL